MQLSSTWHPGGSLKGSMLVRAQGFTLGKGRGRFTTPLPMLQASDVLKVSELPEDHWTKGQRPPLGQHGASSHPRFKLCDLENCQATCARTTSLKLGQYRGAGGPVVVNIQEGRDYSL